MAVEAVLALVLAISVLSLVVAFFLARQVLAADTGQPAIRHGDAAATGWERCWRRPTGWPTW